MAGIVVVGLLFCFLGYRIFRVLLVFAGAVFGAMGAMGLANQQWPQSVAATVIAGILGACVGGVLMVVAYYLGVFLAGAAFGAATAAIVTGANTQNPQLLAVIPATIIGGLLALVLQKVLIILATSFMGSLATVTGASFFIWRSEGFDLSKMTPQLPTMPSSIPLTEAGKLDWHSVFQQGILIGNNPHAGVMLVWWVVLGVVGVMVQHFWTAKRKHHAHIHEAPPAS